MPFLNKFNESEEEKKKKQQHEEEEKANVFKEKLEIMKDE